MDGVGSRGEHVRYVRKRRSFRLVYKYSPEEGNRKNRESNNYSMGGMLRTGKRNIGK